MKGKWDATKRNALKQAASKQQGGPGRQRGSDEDEGPLLIWGVHAVEAALMNPARPFIKLWATDNAALRMAKAIEQRQVMPEQVTPKDLDIRLGADTVHQGALVEVGPLPDQGMTELAEAIMGRGPAVVLDQVTDPHNVGAILRSAAVFGSAGLVMTRRNSPPLGGALAKSASGALDLVPISLVTNLVRSLTELKDAGVMVIGLDGDAPQLLEDVILDGAYSTRPIALVLGAEGRGLRQLTGETCDMLCRIGTDGPLASLNVSNAAAVALHLTSMARRRKTTATGS